MKKIVSMLAMLGLLGTMSAYAGDEYYEKKDTSKNMEEREVIYYDFNLELEVENGVVEAEWDEFEGEGFDWYKLVYSTSNSKPVYPVDKTVFVGSEDQTESSFKLQGGKTTHYVRICAITLNDDYSKDRYCGDVQKIETDNDDVADREEKEYTKEKYIEKKKEVKQKNTELTSTLKSRVDEVIGDFVEGLEDKGYSDTKIAATISIVIERLGNYKNKAEYKNLVAYMIQVLEEYKEEYSNPLEELESIFEGL